MKENKIVFVRRKTWLLEIKMYSEMKLLALVIVLLNRSFDSIEGPDNVYHIVSHVMFNDLIL